MRTPSIRLGRSPPTKPRAGRKLTLQGTSSRHFKRLQRTQEELKQARHYAEAIVEAVPPLLVLDANLRVKTANESFYKHFRVSPPQTENRLVYELGNGQWNIPELRTFLEEVLPRHSCFKDFEVTHHFETIGRRTVLLSGRQVNALQRILLFVDDITERVESRLAMRASEIRYRRLFEAARDGILILDPNTRRITDANPFMTELLGYSHEELLGKELWEIGLLKDEKASQAAFRELQKKYFIRYEDLPLQNKAGQHHEVEFVSNLYDEDGKYVIQCNIRDITERKRAEKALLAAKNEIDRHALELEQVVAERTGELRETIGELQNLKAAVDAHSIVAITDTKGDITYVNDKFCEISKYSREELLGQNHRIINSGYHPKEFFKDLWTTIARGHAWKGDVQNRAKDGTIYWVATTISPFLDAQGKPTQYIAIRTDITERKDDEKRLIELARSLAEKIGELEAFSYSVSHDMRAPLRAMQSFASYLVEEYRDKLDGQGVNYLEQIMRSAVRLDRLIQDVLSYTRILHTKLPMVRVDLDRLVRDIVETLPDGQPIPPQIHIKGTLPKVVGNEALLAQCVSNLLSNSAKFVARGTTPQVEISAEESDPSLVRIWVKDNGIGIAPENHDRIFRLFERIHPATEYEGTGIGLTIVRKAIERMGAQVGFESELGKGSRFWMQFKRG